VNARNHNNNMDSFISLQVTATSEAATKYKKKIQITCD